MSTENTKSISKVKIFFSALLGYTIFNLVRNTLYAIVSLIAENIGASFIRFRLKEIALFLTLYVGYSVCRITGKKLLKTDDGTRRYLFTVGILLIINYTYFIFDYFRYKEGDFLFILLGLASGIVLILNNTNPNKYITFYLWSPRTGYQEEKKKTKDLNQNTIDKWLDKETNCIYCIERCKDGEWKYYYTTKQEFYDTYIT